MSQKECVFCFEGPEGNQFVESERVLKGYEFWWLILQREAVRDKTIQAAGMLVAKRHIQVVSQATPEEFGEVVEVMHDSGLVLCQAVGAQYTGETRLGFNEGTGAGQTVDHAHLHVLPVADTDPQWDHPGIIGAFEELHRARMEDDAQPGSQ